MSKRVELFLEEWATLLLSIMAAGTWLLFGKRIIPFLSTPSNEFYSAVINYSAICVAFLAAASAIIFSAPDHFGVKLLKSNSDMFNRFVGYISSSVYSNIALLTLSLVALAIGHNFKANGFHAIIVFTLAFSLLSLLRVQILFAIIMKKN